MTHSQIAAERIADSAVRQLPDEILGASGRALYSPSSTLTSGSPIYFLGLNPGEIEGGTEFHDLLSVRSDLERLRAGKIEQHGYLDERWKGNAPGTAPIQRRGQKLFTILANGDPIAGSELLRRTPTSNIILPRSSSAALLEAKTGLTAFDLAVLCWPFHQAVISECKCEVVLTHAVTVAKSLARSQRMGLGWERPSGWGGSFSRVYAWEMPEGPRLLAIPNLSRYSPDKQRVPPLEAFFREFGPKSR
jgi:hypothetical protein